MTLQGLFGAGQSLLSWRCAQLMCWWVLCDLTRGLLFRWFPVLGL